MSFCHLKTVFFSLFLSVNIFAQTGIGTSTPDASAKLDVYSTNKGFLPPRVTLTSSSDNVTISNPATGLLVYNTGNNAGLIAGYYYWNGSSWITIASTLSSQSVDYGIARYTGADGGSLSANALVSFDASAAGNLTWSGNKFTLKANKTYEIESGLAIYYVSGGGVAGKFQIYDYTNSNALANGLFMSQNGNGSYAQSANTPMKCIITPTTDIQVGIRLLDWYGPGGPGIIGNASVTGSTSSTDASYFIVKQIGSSAIINPWTLSGTSTYNITGNVGIGNNSPTAALDVTGAAKISGTLTAGGNAFPTTLGTNGYALTTNAAGTTSWNAVPPVGVINIYAGSTAPTGYLLCDGSAVSRTTYSVLYSIIGTTYGTGNGSTTFNLPDLRTRVPVGKNSSGTFANLATTGGEETHTLTISEMPSHDHSATVNSAAEVGTIGGYVYNTQTMFFATDRTATTKNTNAAIQNTGGGGAHNNLQPYIVVNYIIKY